MDARTVWFRENGERKPKGQLLIETMFCVYYLSKGSAVLTLRALEYPDRISRLYPHRCARNGGRKRAARYARSLKVIAAG